ncbi:MAG TPA: flagellar biosynthetic protein FliO [Zeimonas sp.]|nr:flagellar biosynthetic protein FliO [Zeimonas sp.]
MSSTWPSLVALALILVGLPLAAWLLRRGPGVLAGRGSALAIVAAVPVGARERIAIVRADRTWLVVGITGQSITTLAQLDGAPAGIDADATGAMPGGFGDVLRSLSHHASRRR